MTGPRIPLSDRFWQYVDKTDYCWIWKGCLHHTGYGIIRINYQNVQAHRASWELHNGEIPEGLWVLHHCDNPPCVNPEHLFLGTNVDNMRDKLQKGRAMQGTDHCLSKLNPDIVREIRASNDHNSILAQKYQVSRYTIYAVRTSKTWKSVL